MNTIFFTGFPGFLGAELLPRILARSPDHRAACLVQAKFAGLAQRRAQEIENAHPDLKGRIDILEGDIAQPGLGLAGTTGLVDRCVEIYHLAAIYDLSVGPRDRDAGQRGGHPAHAGVRGDARRSGDSNTSAPAM